MILKRIVMLLLLLGLCSATVLHGQGTLVITDTNEPSGSGTPVSSPSHDANVGASIGVGIGQSFITTAAFDLARITLKKSTTQGYNPGNYIRLRFFSWNPSNDANDMTEWGKGDGNLDGDPFNRTGMVELHREDFVVPPGNQNGLNYMHFNLSSSIALAANTAYGFTIEFLYIGSGGDNITLLQERGLSGDVFGGGKKISATTSENSNGINGNMVFYLSDTIVVVPPSLGTLRLSPLEALGRSALVSNSIYNASQSCKNGEAVGQTFTTSSAFNMTSLTLLEGTVMNFKYKNKFRVTVFALDPPTDASDTTKWVKGDGLSDNDLLDLTGMTPLYSEAFEIPAGITSGTGYFHFDLNASIPLEANKAYGFTVEYVYGGEGGATQASFKRHNGAGTDGGNVYAGGRMVSVTQTGHVSGGNANLAFYLGDTLAAADVKVNIVGFEVVSDSLCKMTVNTLYPSLAFPRWKTDLADPNGWWSDVTHSPDGVAPFMATNLEYSTTDVDGNHVIYLQKAGPRSFFIIGPEPTGNFETRIYDNGTHTLPYRMLKPNVYDPNVAYPLVIAFHGAGGTGTDNTSRAIEAMNQLSSKEVRSQYPAFVITPQSLGNWAATPWGNGRYDLDTTPITLSMTLVYEIIDALELEFNIDPKRIYVTGQSMGGFGAWDCVMRDPSRFAALVPMAGGGDPTKAATLLNVPIWNFHGAIDNVVATQGSRDMDAAMIAAGHRNWTYTEYPGVGHAVTGPAWDEVTLIPWIFSQTKK